MIDIAILSIHQILSYIPNDYISAMVKRYDSWVLMGVKIAVEMDLPSPNLGISSNSWRQGT